jgi:hypothetical protein
LTVIVTTSVSAGTPWWDVAKPNWAEYCDRHGYRLAERQEEYAAALDGEGVARLLDECDLLWSLDADCIITNLTIRIEAIECLGPHATICREGHQGGPLLNGGSMVWRNTPQSRHLLERIRGSREEWASRRFLSQDWLCDRHEELSGVLTVVPERTFNSVWPLWQPGDFVFHACGMGADDRIKKMRERLGEVIR